MKTVWGSRAQELLAELITRRGCSAREAAGMLTRLWGREVTKNMVIGACNRLKISLAGGRDENRRPLGDFPPPVKARSRARPTPAITPAAAERLVASWLTIRDGECRFPLGELPGMRPCGLPTAAGRVYCPDHDRLAHRPSPPLERDLSLPSKEGRRYKKFTKMS